MNLQKRHRIGAAPVDVLDPDIAPDVAEQLIRSGDLRVAQNPSLSLLILGDPALFRVYEDVQSYLPAIIKYALNGLWEEFRRIEPSRATNAYLQEGRSSLSAFWSDELAGRLRIYWEQEWGVRLSMEGLQLIRESAIDQLEQLAREQIRKFGVTPNRSTRKKPRKGSVGGFAPFDHQKNPPSPKELRTLQKVAPSIARKFDTLSALYELAEPAPREVGPPEGHLPEETSLDESLSLLSRQDCRRFAADLAEFAFRRIFESCGDRKEPEIKEPLVSFREALPMLRRLAENPTIYSQSMQDEFDEVYEASIIFGRYAEPQAEWGNCIGCAFDSDERLAAMDALAWFSIAAENSHNTQALHWMHDRLLFYLGGGEEGSSVGARTRTKDDPNATTAQLDQLAKRDKLAALAHPKATQEQLLRWLVNGHRRDGLGQRLQALTFNPAFVALQESHPPLDNALLIQYWRDKSELSSQEMKSVLSRLPANLVFEIAMRALMENAYGLQSDHPDAYRTIVEWVQRIAQWRRNTPYPQTTPYPDLAVLEDTVEKLSSSVNESPSLYLGCALSYLRWALEVESDPNAYHQPWDLLGTSIWYSFASETYSSHQMGGAPYFSHWTIYEAFYNLHQQILEFIAQVKDKYERGIVSTVGKRPSRKRR